MWYLRGPDLAECIFYFWNSWMDFLDLKFFWIVWCVHICDIRGSWVQPLDEFSPFKVIRNCPDLQLCSVMCIVHLTHVGLPMGQSTCLWNHWTDFLGSKKVLWDSPISQCFFPSSEQLEQHVLAHTLWQLTAGYIAIFRKYYCFTMHGGIITS